MSDKTNAHVHSQSKTARMIAGFMTLWNQGYRIPDIANKFGLSRSAVYNQLDKIAEREGLPSKECFLASRKGAKHIHAEPQPDDGTPKNGQGQKLNTAPFQPFEPGVVSALFDTAISNLEGLMDGVQQTVSTYSAQSNIGGEQNE